MLSRHLAPKAASAFEQKTFTQLRLLSFIGGAGKDDSNNNHGKNDNSNTNDGKCFILGIGTSNPKTVVHRQEALAFAAAIKGADASSKLSRIYDKSAIEQRRIAFIPSGAADLQMSPQQRSAAWMKAAKVMAKSAVETALHRAGVRIEEVGNLIFMTSTESRAPGLDVSLVNQLNFNADVKRSFLGWMGCGAAINGLELARTWTQTQQMQPHRAIQPHSQMQEVTEKDQVSLHLAIDVPSVHMSFTDDVEMAVFHAIMGDGCAATVLGGEQHLRRRKNENNDNISNNHNTADIRNEIDVWSRYSVELVDSFSHLVKNTEEVVQWGGGTGASLSQDLSQIVKDNVESLVGPFLATRQLSPTDIDFWCIHPGGPKILEAVQHRMQLRPHQTRASWNVLKNYGNMISPTLMFVIEETLRTELIRRAGGGGGGGQEEDRENAGESKTEESSNSSSNVLEKDEMNIVALGFSPGVSVDAILLKCKKL